MLKAVAVIIPLILAVSPSFAYQSLQEIFNQAGPYAGFDKYIELDPALEYLGDLHVSGDIRTRLIGHGAIIHGVNYDIAIGVRTGYAEISGCVIVGGGFGIYYAFGASGDIYNNTIYGSSLYGISTIYQDTIDGVHIWDNIITNCYCGILCIEDILPAYYGYNTIWAIEAYRYAEQCLDWGGTLQPFGPGQGDQNLNPLFIDQSNNDFSLQANSPCIGSGRYGGDRGALPHQTGIKDNPARPAAFGMPGNYPNPFNSSTMIKYTLPSAGDVRIEIFDISGGRIHTVYLSDQLAGEHSFLWQADNQPSGVYFYKISTNEYVRTNRMVLVK